MSVKVLNNRYQILSVIKKGGFGIIYKGYDSVLGKDIILKEIKPEYLADAEIIDQFQNEARSAAKMNHQNIVHIFDLVQDESGNFYIVMEYIDGLDLGSLIQNCQKEEQVIPQHLTLHILAEVCKALDYAHNCRNPETNEPLNFVHQDISPSNIMISNTGMLKLIDFGLTGMQKKSLADEDYLELRGKVQYMSPEHVSPELNLDKRSDIFSLGLVLYESLEGKRFFHLEHNQKIIETLRNGKLKVKDFKRTPKPLRKVVQKALARSPEDRYQNANQLYIDLVTFLASNFDSTSIDTELAHFVTLNTRSGSYSPKDTSSESSVDGLTVLDEVENDVFSKSKKSKEDLDKIEEFIFSQPEKNTRPPVSLATPESFSEDKVTSSDTYFEGEDEVKTIIDVIRLSERGHKQLFAKSGIAAAGFLVLLFFLDIAFQWTAIGTAIYDFIFPPAIKITSMPSGAKVYLNNKLLPGVTPMEIDKIQPGAYELKLIMKSYSPIVKSLIIPRKGDIKITGEQSRRGNEPYIFRFKTTLEINSTPPNAEVYINKIKYGQNTPCTVTWEVGEICEIELRKSGFQDLAGFSLDTENMLEEIDDRRLWNFQIEREPTIRYILDGLLGKYISFRSNPPNAAIYLDDNAKPVGRTGKKDNIFLTAASHKIVLKKKRYNSKIIKVNVDEKTPSQISATLTRPVKFMAYDATNGKDKDLEAVTKLVRNGKTIVTNRRTPFKLNLQPTTYTATFSTKGFKTTKIKISKKDEVVVAKMEPWQGQYSVVILDEESNSPLSEVEIRFISLDNPNQSKEFTKLTDEDGTCNGNLTPGLYLLRTWKNGYAYQEKSIMIEPSDLNLIEFNLKRL